MFPPFPVTVFPPRQKMRSTLSLLQRRALPRQVTTSIQVRQAAKLQLGQTGKVTGAQLGTGPSRPPRGTALPPRQTALFPGKAILHLPPNRLPQGSSSEDPNPKWVINLSSKPLTPAQRSVLAKGPNIVVSPKQPPNLEYITAIEAACTKLSQQDAEECRADINRVLRSFHPPNPT